MRTPGTIELTAVEHLADVVQDHADPNKPFVEGNVEPSEPSEKDLCCLADEFCMPTKTGGRTNRRQHLHRFLTRRWSHRAHSLIMTKFVHPTGVRLRHGRTLCQSRATS